MLLLLYWFQKRSREKGSALFKLFVIGGTMLFLYYVLEYIIKLWSIIIYFVICIVFIFYIYNEI